jgi:hypothetical protein
MCPFIRLRAKNIIVHAVLSAKKRDATSYLLLSGHADAYLEV